VLAALLTSSVDFWMSFQEIPHYHQFAGIVPVTWLAASHRHGSCREPQMPARLMPSSKGQSCAQYGMPPLSLPRAKGNAQKTPSRSPGKASSRTATRQLRLHAGNGLGWSLPHLLLRRRAAMRSSRLIQRTGLLLDQRQIMQRIEHELGLAVAPPMPRDLGRAGEDHDLLDEPLHDHLAEAVPGRHRVVVAAMRTKDVDDTRAVRVSHASNGAAGRSRNADNSA